MIDDSMLKAAEAEVRRLEAELEKTPAYKRLQAARNLIAVYRNDPEVEPARPSNVQGSHALPTTVSPSVGYDIQLGSPPPATKTARVEKAVTDYLIRKGRRATSGELLPVVLEQGIAITGKIPSKTMASYLSTSKRFDNVPAFGGYGLVEWNKRRGPATATTTDNSGPASEKGASGLFS